MQNPYPSSDLIIVGGGPVGLFGCFIAGLRTYSVRLIEALPELGGQVNALYPQKDILDVAGFPRIQGGELIERLKQQALAYPVQVHCSTRAEELIPQGEDGFLVKTDRGTFSSKAVVVTAGLGAFTPRRPEINDLERFEGHGVSYSPQNLERFRGQSVAVMGGGNTALDWAMALLPYVRKLYLVHILETFQGHEASLQRIADDQRATILNPWQITRLNGDRELQSLEVRDLGSGQTDTLDVQALIIGIGFNSDLGPIKRWGFNLHGAAVLAGPGGETNLPGVFAAGDVAMYQNKLKLIATGFGEVALAVQAAHPFIHPGERARFVHSTNLKDKD